MQCNNVYEILELADIKNWLKNNNLNLQLEESYCDKDYFGMKYETIKELKEDLEVEDYFNSLYNDYDEAGDEDEPQLYDNLMIYTITNDKLSIEVVVDTLLENEVVAILKNIKNE